MPVTIGCRTLSVTTLSAEQRSRMFELHSRYFAGVTPTSFEADLAEKDWVLMLMADGAIVGFSSLMSWRQTASEAGGEVLVLFSGDTIVDARHRHETVLMKVWAELAAALIRDSGLPGYWFLLCGGYKTYRFLPLFLRTFHPMVGAEPDADLESLLAACAERKFGARWDPDTGIVRLGDGVSLRSGVADLDERRLANPHVAYFARLNPGHARGDELACIARFMPDNLTRAGRAFHPDGMS